MIRITGGKHRSRLLDVPNGELSKPTMDKVRLAVFSIIGEKIINARTLDLFACSGSYGFESLSRGAKSSTFVDNSFQAIKTIKNNAFKLNEDVSTYSMNVITFLKQCEEQYDIIFIDPPYKLEIYEETISLIFENNILDEKGIIIIESDKELEFLNKYENIKKYKYGYAQIYVLRK